MPKKKTMIVEIALYSVTPWADVAACPFRAALRAADREFKDLNYHGCDEDARRAAVEPLKTWFDETTVEVEDMPFVVVQVAHSDLGTVKCHLLVSLEDIASIGRL